MTDTPTPTPDPEPTPFGAGVPTEPVESVRLPPGLGHGPALDIRGQVAPPRGEATSTATTAAEMTPQPFVGWIIPAAAGAAGAGNPPTTAPPIAASTHSSSAASVLPETATPPPAPAASAPSPAPAFAAAPPAPSAATPPPAAPKPPRRWWVAIAHLAFLIPFPPGVVVTAVLWIWRRSRDPLMADQGREALNMQLTFWLAMGLLGATCVASPLVPFVYVLGAVLCLLAAIAAWGGDRHRYPWVFRFLT